MFNGETSWTGIIAYLIKYRMYDDAFKLYGYEANGELDNPESFVRLAIDSDMQEEAFIDVAPLYTLSKNMFSGIFVVRLNVSLDEKYVIRQRIRREETLMTSGDLSFLVTLDQEMSNEIKELLRALRNVGGL